MEKTDPRIATALLSIDPTSKHPAWHGAPTSVVCYEECRPRARSGGRTRARATFARLLCTSHSGRGVWPTG